MAIEDTFDRTDFGNSTAIEPAQSPLADHTLARLTFSEGPSATQAIRLATIGSEVDGYVADNGVDGGRHALSVAAARQAA